jgi:hypothetical protein
MSELTAPLRRTLPLRPEKAAPDFNLILAGTLGVGQREVAQRRLHAALGDAFHTERAHAIEIARLKREWKVRALPGLAHLDTTLLTPDQVAAEAIAFWQSTPEV